jgi:hypothetical protein
MDWFEEYERSNKVSENAAAERESTGTVRTNVELLKNYTCNQWKQRGRRVVVPNVQAKKSITDRKTGHTLYLYSIEQTAKRTD